MVAARRPATLSYCGLELDRAPERRGDRAWLESVRASAQVVPLWRDKCLVGATREAQGFEEAGVVVRDVRYQASQAWPFPAGPMVGFRATAVTDEFTVDGAELAEAKWFTPDELRSEYPSTVDSIEGYLVREWLATA